MSDLKEYEMSVEDKLDALKDKQQEMNITLAEIKVDLAHHISRSDKHEKQIDRLWYILFAIFAGGASKFGPEVVQTILGGQ